MYTSANNPPLVCNGKYAKKNLRSLVVSAWCDISLDILKELEVLRVLILDSAHTSLLPESFRKMLHLRYLEISTQPVLPQSMSRLYHLEVLSLMDYIYSRNNDSSSCQKELTG